MTLPAPTVATNFSSARNINSPTGGQWQASTAGKQVVPLPHGTVPTTGATSAQTIIHSAASNISAPSYNPTIAPSAPSGTGRPGSPAYKSTSAFHPSTPLGKLTTRITSAFNRSPATGLSGGTVKVKSR